MKPFVRAAENPLITPDMVKPSLEGYRVVCAFNAGVAQYKDETLLLLRVAEKPPTAPVGFLNVPVLCETETGIWQVEVHTLALNDSRYDFSDPRKVLDKQQGNYVFLTSISHLRLARSRDGIHFTVDDAPLIRPDCALEAFGTEDARITQLGDTYYINYTAVSINGITTALAVTKDFVHVEKKGIIFVTENRDVTIFPDKLDGLYYALVRPVPHQIGRAQIWVAASSDLLHWGEFSPLPLPSFSWSDSRNGGGAVPIRTEKGWLILYHGADKASNRYSMGAALLDGTNPRKVLAVSAEPVLEPETDYERQGFYPNVVFSCGAILTGDTVSMYYGAADRVMGLARAKLNVLWDALGVNEDKEVQHGQQYQASADER
ncbi:MAG: glycoside hydrolase family 130 protein [Eubacteriales bacterium]|nr:glycoside hydrolase family 130 protein [Eubacteriales bacterium]